MTALLAVVIGVLLRRRAPPDDAPSSGCTGMPAQNRLDRESLEFHERVVSRYLAEQGPGVVHLDARQPADRLLQAAVGALLAARPNLIPGD